MTPLELSDVLDVFHPLRRGADLRGRIIEVRRETDEAATIVIEPGRDWSGHVPGSTSAPASTSTASASGAPTPDPRPAPGPLHQHHRQGDPGRGRLRPPRAPGARRPDGPARPGRGRPCCRSRSRPKLLLVTAGSGITPVIGMLRNLFSRSTPYAGDIVLLHSRDDPRQRHLRPRAAVVRRRAAAAPRRAPHRRRRPARRRRPRHDRARPGRAHGVRLSRPGCSMPRRPTSTSAG